MAWNGLLAHTCSQKRERPIRGRGGVIGPWNDRRVPRADYLFNESDLRGALEAYEKRMHDEIDSIDGDEFLNTSPEDLAEHFIDDFRINVPVLDEAAISVDQGEAKVDVSRDTPRMVWDRSRPFYITGTRLTFFIPYEGDRELFKCHPSRSYMGNWPSAEVRDGEIVVTVMILKHDPEAVKTQFDRELGMIRSYLGWILSDVDPFNQALPDKVREIITKRREKLLADRGLAASLGYPLRERMEGSKTYAVPPKRRRPPPPRPRTSEPFEPEPTLPDADYEQILTIMTNMVDVIERSPAAFRGMKEEDLRQHFLVQLNGQYEGGATGETFNGEGKTDILIRVEGRTIFIAECKFWNGPKALTLAIDQLLGYTSWRDTKTALLVFNRERSLTNVLARVPEVMTAHPNFKRETSVAGETRFRYVFAHRDDPNRELLLTVLVFEVPA